MSGMTRALVCGVSLCAMALGSAAAFAHTGSGTGGFVGGFEHPLFEPDHVAAMLAVGLWGAFLGPPAIWLLPIVFPLVMACGAVAGIVGVALPRVEICIAVFALGLGVMVGLAGRPPFLVPGGVGGGFSAFPRPTPCPPPPPP